MADSNAQKQTESTASFPKPHLELMPPELFEVMAQYLGPRDLFSLRRVSKQCKDKAQKTFLEEWFSEGSLSIHDEESLEEMLKLVNDPVYGPALRKIVISIDQWLPWPPDSNEDSDEDPYEPRWQEQKKSQYNCMASNRLTSIFRKAREVANVSELCITEGAHPPEVEHSLQASIYGESINDDPMPAYIVFESLWRSGLRVKTLSRTGPAQERFDTVYFLPIYLLAWSPSAEQRCKDVLESITSISMQVEIPEVDHTDLARNFLRCMGPSLEHLSLRVDGDDIRWDPKRLEYRHYSIDERAPELFLEDLSFPSLRTVELDYSTLSAETLIGFIKRVSSLQKISLYGMEIQEWPQAIGDWNLGSQVDPGLVEGAPSVQEILRIMAGFQEIHTDEGTERDSRYFGWYN